MKSIRTILVSSFLMVWLSSSFGASPDDAHPQSKLLDSPSWDKESAAKYLDDRMDLWFAKAKKLRTGEGVASCVSCHTAVPYSMVRPVLRKALGQTKPTPQETRLLDETVRRVDTYANHETLYKSKDEQSRGTEVVLNLLILAGDDAGQNRKDPSEATRKALQELWKEQRPDGAWNWLDFALEPYESIDGAYYGAALAAISLGTIPGYASSSDENALIRIAELNKYLIGNYSRQNLYNRTWMLLASTRLKGLLTRDQSNTLTAELQVQQNSDGGWSLQKLGPWTWSKTSPPFGPEGKPDTSVLGQSDGYASGLISYALHRAGMAAEHPVLRRARSWLEANQREFQIDQHQWKCWRTHSLNYDREHGGDEGEPWRRMFMSDAATAFAALALLPSD